MTSGVKHALRSGRPHRGLIAKLPCPVLVELAGWLGFACVVLDTEHGPADDALVLEHVRAADAAGIDALVRVRDGSPAGILAALDAGAAGIVVPHVSSGSQAAVVAAAAHFPPAGTRGLSLSTRAARHGLVPAAEHRARSAARTTVIVQIEDGAAVDAIDEICGAPLLDGILPGPVDLAAATGRADVASLIARCRAAARRAGVACCAVADAAAPGPADDVALTLLNTSQLQARVLAEAVASVAGPL